MIANHARRTRVLYSFPHKLGATRICHTAWQQVLGIAAAGADVLLFPGVLHRPVPEAVVVRPTLARGRMRVPYKVLGKLRTLALHDYVVARRLQELGGQVDIVHVWPMAAKRTLQTAARLGIPTVLERPNAHTRVAYVTVQNECQLMGIALPRGHEYEYNEEIITKEEEEYKLAYRLLCPSDFVVQTFLDQGVRREKLLRHQYGFDERVYYPTDEPPRPGRGLTMLFAGVAAVRKGVHFALEAWLKSTASREGRFLIAGEFLPTYREKLGSLLSHPSVQLLGHRLDLPDLMRTSDVLVLPSIEEGSALVTLEARGSGCVLLVSDAAGAECTHMETGLVHHARDVEALARHISMLHEDRSLLGRLRAASLKSAPKFTWSAAGERLCEVYRQVIGAYKAETEADSALHSTSVGAGRS
jgi:glycosyltransferase involved in cell wall biosynthesis